MTSKPPNAIPTLDPTISSPAVPSNRGDIVRDDKVGGNKTTTGDINHSAVAIGDGAQAILTIIERALTAVEVADQAEVQAKRRLGEALFTYVQGLAEQAERAQNQAARQNPYKALLSYDLQDMPVFFGQDENCDELMRHLDNGRLTVLYAESGAGKTSLLKAGLMSRLVAREDVPVYLRPRDTPVPLRLKSFLLPALNETPILADDSLQDFLRRATNLLPGRELVVLVDQFEDVFDLQADEVRADFGKQLAECLDDETLRVRWVLALREEYLHRLGGFRQIKEPFGNSVLLPRMTREQAQAVIVEPSCLRGVTWKPGVVDGVLAELAADDQGILPVQLQIVCSELFQRAGKDGAITLPAYQDAGGVQGILGSYLNNVLERQMAPGQREVARQLLEKLAASEPEMRLSKGVLAELLHGDAIDKSTTDEVLKQLQDAFLVRMEVVDGHETVELAHRYLLDQLQPDEETKEVVAAKKLLERWVQEYAEQGMLLDADRLAIIETQWDKLGVADDSQAAELRKKSADKLKRQRGYVRLGIGTVLILAIAALLSVVGLGVARTETGNSVAKAQAAETVAADAQVVAAAAGATAQVAQTVAADARAMQTAAEAAASDAEARAAAAAVILKQQFDTTGTVLVGDWPGALVKGGASLWVAVPGNKTVQQIDPGQGIVVASIPVEGGSNALAWGGGNLWVASSFYSGTVQMIDPDKGVPTAPIRVGDHPSALAWDGSSLWATNAVYGAAVKQIDPGSGVELATIEVGNIPNALAWDGSSLWVANSGDNTVQKVDPNKRTEESPIRVGRNPRGLAWDGSNLWVANISDSTVMRIDPAGMGAVVATIPVGDYPGALAWDGASLWVSNYYSNTVQQIDPAGTGKVVATIQVGHYPGALAWDGSSLWVVNSGDNGIQKIDPGKNAVLASIDVGENASAPAWDGNSLWVVAEGDNGDNVIRQIDPGEGAVASIPVERGLGALTWDGSNWWGINYSSNTVQQIDPDRSDPTTTIRVGNYPSALAWDGSGMWVANRGDDTVQRIDPRTGIPEAPIEVGDGPCALAWDGSSLWVANFGSETVQQIDPGEGVVAEIEVGKGPCELAWDDGSLWVANSHSYTVQQIAPDADKPVQTVEVRNSPSALVWDGISLWVASFPGDFVQQIDPGKGAVVATVNVGKGPTHLAWDGTSVWVTYQDGTTVQEINARSLNLILKARQLAQAGDVAP